MAAKAVKPRQDSRVKIEIEETHILMKIKLNPNKISLKSAMKIAPAYLFFPVIIDFLPAV